MKRVSGFTLFEILIAVFIFAILGTLAGLTLHSVIRTHKRLNQVDQALMAVQVGVVLLERDISQIVDRPVTEPNGMQQPAVMTFQNTGIAFTTYGKQNPGFAAKSSLLARMAYSLQGDKLVRSSWLVLDPTADTAMPATKVVLQGLQSFQVQFVDQQNRLVNYWPERNQSVSSDKSKAGTQLPKAIMVTLDFKRWGSVQRMINLAGVTRRVSIPQT